MTLPRISTVIFDFGGVLSLPLDAERCRMMSRWCGFTPRRFRAAFLCDRRAYDRGDVDLRGYWSPILALGGRLAEAGLLEKLNREDLHAWCRMNERMLAWADELRAAGFRTAILSDMPQSLVDLLRRDPGFTWVREFDVKVFSCEVHVTKPEPGIFRHMLSLLREEPGRCLFLDDSRENAAGARSVGIQGMHYTSMSRLVRAVRTLGLPVSALSASAR
jgi:putative hydrolase of the HAD superfamily